MRSVPIVAVIILVIFFSALLLPAAFLFLCDSLLPRTLSFQISSATISLCFASVREKRKEWVRSDAMKKLNVLPLFTLPFFFGVSRCIFVMVFSVVAKRKKKKSSSSIVIIMVEKRWNAHIQRNDGVFHAQLGVRSNETQCASQLSGFPALAAPRFRRQRSCCPVRYLFFLNTNTVSFSSFLLRTECRRKNGRKKHPQKEPQKRKEKHSLQLLNNVMT
ncbi:hypothetical protein ABB37_02118 [Leptomonas pyrrhocoris]|uniref:Uncharacterized protein n=1 Tax=Leptomonas pyrrhocoris TaxID=157538 RepID=A0A0N0VGT0_LEPPY|nr:hypothetical protein ABB37_02118 [Leptomonas pyrrhocoris]KPA83974.1 hypothetical protein ABB37_02118 [Leptomonas pyrrhocoris]|eukprot:XP_015662413.1 hypothetical protein ABB37_02118 [Leptomonas pyrrhocoris]